MEIDTAKIKVLLKSGLDPKEIARMLENVEQTEKTADALGVRFKDIPAPSQGSSADVITWAQSQIGGSR